MARWWDRLVVTLVQVAMAVALGLAAYERLTRWHSALDMMNVALSHLLTRP